VSASVLANAQGSVYPLRTALPQSVKNVAEDRSDLRRIQTAAKSSANPMVSNRRRNALRMDVAATPGKSLGRIKDEARIGRIQHEPHQSGLSVAAAAADTQTLRSHDRTV
jgi:hypothetical protein